MTDLARSRLTDLGTQKLSDRCCIPGGQPCTKSSTVAENFPRPWWQWTRPWWQWTRSPVSLRCSQRSIQTRDICALRLLRSEQHLYAQPYAQRSTVSGRGLDLEDVVGTKEEVERQQESAGTHAPQVEGSQRLTSILICAQHYLWHPHG